MSQTQRLAAVRDSNELRASSNQEFIGGIYFLIAFGMALYATAIAIVQAYVVPLHRFADCNSALGNPKFVSAFYSLLLNIFFFLISAAGGMSGFIVASAILFLWLIALAIVGVVRRKAREREEEEEMDSAAQQRTSSTVVDDDASPALAVSGSAPPMATTTTTAPAGAKSGAVTSHDADPWSVSPARISSRQLVCLSFCLACIVSIVAILLIIVFTWNIPDYKVVDPADRTVIEIQPPLTAKALQFMYAYPEVATNLQLDIYVKLLTEWCGSSNSANLTSDADKQREIQEGWIDKYAINMSVYVLTSFRNFTSVNDWFTRAINITYRPVPADTTAIVSPADCRMLVYRNVDDSATYWFKGYSLSTKNLIGNMVVEGSTNYFDKGSLVIARLAPQDYHRFHSSVSGTVIAILSIPGSLWSVSADAARSGNQAFLNSRKVMIIDAGPRIGKVAYVAIGATCVGSVVLQDSKGQEIKIGALILRGDQLGVMAFGGSTVAMLFAADRIVWDTALEYRSTFPVETLVQANSAIGNHR